MAIYTSFLEWNNEPSFTGEGEFATKFFYFGGPYVKKDIIKVIFTGSGNGTGFISARKTQGGVWFDYGVCSFVGDGDDDNFIVEVLPPSSINSLGQFIQKFQSINGVQIRLKFTNSPSNTLVFDDISIMYRQYREIDISEDE